MLESHTSIYHLLGNQFLYGNTDRTEANNNKEDEFNNHNHFVLCKCNFGVSYREHGKCITMKNLFVWFNKNAAIINVDSYRKLMFSVVCRSIWSIWKSISVTFWLNLMNKMDFVSIISTIVQPMEQQQKLKDFQGKLTLLLCGQLLSVIAEKVAIFFIWIWTL